MEGFIYKPIGFVTSPFQDKESTPKFYTDSGDTLATLEILPEYTDALLGVVPGMRLLMLFNFHQNTEQCLQVKKRGTGPLTGVFATRSTRRPNPIGVSIITVVSIEGNSIRFHGVDVLDGTPVLDLKVEKS